ncbi:DivIVA domain-containing protein [Bengtsoniella intestinalis]|uniref:DivIVA domain-containing protein n=1 Tax=Bengtsoniella intestinalis TaxID=3073143 RepID=UPI00391F67F0
MLTPQEVSTRAFAKAVMGGYNMAMVDEFLDELTDDYTALYKENATLKAKMKVLVEKVEDYRATEDSMRATLLTAQKMADSIIKEAEEKRAQAFSSIEEETRSRVEEARQELANEQERLRQGKLELARFVAQCRKVCTDQLALLEVLPDLEVQDQVAQAVAVEKMAQTIETTVEQVMEEELPVEEESSWQEEAWEEAPQRGAREQASEDTQDLSGDLLFGKNYK